MKDMTDAAYSTAESRHTVAEPSSPRKNNIAGKPVLVIPYVCHKTSLAQNPDCCSPQLITGSLGY